MTKIKPLLISILICFLLGSGTVTAQVSGCDEILVETKVTEPSNGRNDGKVEFKFKDDSKSYKIFITNLDPKNSKKPLTNNTATGLGLGFYDFLIIDQRGCFKEVTISFKGNKK
ncbi:MAG: hypothetical protein QY309_10170 [Cyclobacteriaceae bacterium]|nr:MAG: hypothetical protein QY309_10170 [Cyclobacteriaceae bacterium]